jgi:hypothetical protein
MFWGGLASMGLDWPDDNRLSAPEHRALVAAISSLPLPKEESNGIRAWDGDLRAATPPGVFSFGWRDQKELPRF